MIRISAVRVKSVSIWACVYFTDLKTTRSGGFDLVLLSVDKCAGGQAGVAQFCDSVLYKFALAGDVESAFGGDFLPTFGHEHGKLRLDVAGKCDHRRGGGDFEIEFDMNEFSEAAHVGVLNVASIFAEVDGNAVRAAELRFDRGPDGVGFPRSPCLSNGGDVIDVHAKCNHVRQRNAGMDGKQPDGCECVKNARLVRR